MLKRAGACNHEERRVRVARWLIERHWSYGSPFVGPKHPSFLDAMVDWETTDGVTLRMEWGTTWYYLYGKHTLRAPPEDCDERIQRLCRTLGYALKGDVGFTAREWLMMKAPLPLRPGGVRDLWHPDGYVERACAGLNVIEMLVSTDERLWHITASLLDALPLRGDSSGAYVDAKEEAYALEVVGALRKLVVALCVRRALGGTGWYALDHVDQLLRVETRLRACRGYDYDPVRLRGFEAPTEIVARVCDVHADLHVRQTTSRYGASTLNAVRDIAHETVERLRKDAEDEAQRYLADRGDRRYFREDGSFIVLRAGRLGSLLGMEGALLGLFGEEGTRELLARVWEDCHKTPYLDRR
jgi:hypothetical protein